jgi:hypothetical protein
MIASFQYLIGSVCRLQFYHKTFVRSVRRSDQFIFIGVSSPMHSAEAAAAAGVGALANSPSPPTQTDDSPSLQVDEFDEFDEFAPRESTTLPELTQDERQAIADLVLGVEPLQTREEATGLFGQIKQTCPQSLPAAVYIHIALQTHKKRARLPCLLGGSHSRTDLMALVRALPMSYTTSFHHTQMRKQISLQKARELKKNGQVVPTWRYLMKIYGPVTASADGTQPSKSEIELFYVYMIPSLTVFEIQYLGPKDIGRLNCPQFELQLAYRPPQPALAGYVGTVGFPFSRAVPEKTLALKRSYVHPYRRLRARLKSSFFQSNEGIQNLNLLLSPDITIACAVQLRNEDARKNLGQFLSKFTHGSVRLFYTDIAGTPMFELGNGQYLHGFTLVFPWALALLALHPNCLETDTTFYCVRPYTMAWLLAIFANTSVPLAIGISPSETAESYIRIYDHITELMTKFHPEMLDGPLADEKPEYSIEEFFGFFPNAHFAQPRTEPDADEPPHGSDADEPLEGSDADESLEGSDADEPPGAPQTLDDPDIEEEDRVEILPPDAHEEQYGFAQEDAEQSEDVIDPEPDEIDTVIRVNAEECKNNHAKRSWLTMLAILTDQGAALAKFIKHFNLDWKLCIRHILQAVGTNDAIFGWVMRLIRCFTPEAFIHEAKTIRIELSALDQAPRKAKLLRMMIGDEQVKSHMWMLSRWAAFDRKGIPRPSNHIEGRHMHLNALSEGLEDLVDLIVQVIDYCGTAYERRNLNLHHTLMKNWNRVFPSDEERNSPSFDPAEWEYYWHLFTLDGRSAPDKDAIIDPPIDEYRFPEDFTEVKVTPRLPKKWRPKNDTNKDTAAVPEKQTLHSRGIRSKRDWLAWRIMADLRREHSHERWEKIDTVVFLKIAELGSHLEENPKGGFLPEDEGPWRVGARKFVKDLLKSKEKSDASKGESDASKGKSSAGKGKSDASNGKSSAGKGKSHAPKGKSREGKRKSDDAPKGQADAAVMATRARPDPVAQYYADFPESRLPNQPIGLPNRSNRCYFNAALQCLYHIIPLRDHFLGLRTRRRSGAVCAYQAFQRSLSRPDLGEVQTCLTNLDKLLLNAFQSGRQHDTHEALIILLDLLEKDLLTFPPPGTDDIIAHLFRFQYVTTWHSIKDDVLLNRRVFSDYCLELETPEGTVSLPDCIRAITKELEMTGDEGYATKRANKKVIERTDAKMVTRFTQLPPVLFIHLKRYSFDRAKGLVKKETTVEFSDTLEIGEEMYAAQGEQMYAAQGPGPVYALRAVVTHMGEDNAGHFVAYVSVEGEWWACSDLDTWRVNVSEVLAAEAYLLFYEKLPE